MWCAMFVSWCAYVAGVSTSVVPKHCYAPSGIAGYNAVAYARSILKNSTNDSVKSLVVSMLNYGAQAQLYFGHDTDNLMNNLLTEEHQGLVRGYEQSMMDSVVSVDSQKAGSLTYNGLSYTRRYTTVSFDGAFSINYYFTTANVPQGDVKMYYWTREAYEAATILSPKNASGSFVMTSTGIENQYWAEVSGIAAKDMDQTIFVAGFYSCDGTTYSTGVRNYSIGRYCQGIAAKDDSAQQLLAQATAVYGYYAKEYFANL